MGANETVKSGIESYVKLYDSLGEFLGQATVIDGYISLVPEPAAWAAIFGTFAILYSLRRRRK